MAAEITRSLCEKLIEVLDDIENRTPYCSELRGYKSEFEELKMVVFDVYRLLSHLNKHSNEPITKLEDAVYDADDLIDELLTLAHTNKLELSNSRKGRKFSQNMSRQLKDTYGRLYEYVNANVNVNVNVNDDVNDNTGSFVMTREESSSELNAGDIIIGRDKDKNAIINMLFIGEHTKSGVRFLSIVGVGGLGKTVLAQLVFNDERIIQEFPDPNFRIWVSVSDLNKDFFHLKTRFLQKLIQGKKYFLVLDDVWNEHYYEWYPLEEILKLGQRGSKVLVTTRLMSTATVIGNKDDDYFMLQRLSKEDSWCLFERLAFAPDLEEETHHELVVIGNNIVEKCSCNPLAIKVVGNLLFGQPISKWQSFERSELANIGEGDNGILPILKLSYDMLEQETKSCFRYCAIFSKDSRIQKKKIIGLWIAQGFLEERFAEFYFSYLLDRSFLEDIVRDIYDDVESFKIHELMHIIAQEVGKEEVCTITSIVNGLGNNIRHVNHVGDECLDVSLLKNIRSYVRGCGAFNCKQIDKWLSLRVLDLSGCELKILPESVGKLLHLRFLDLSHSKKLELLCDSITQLHNLQFLDLDKCDNLICMPSGMDKLTNLITLPLFLVGNSISSEKPSSGGMVKDLNALIKIKGKICIRIGTNYRTEEERFLDNEGRYLKSMNLTEIKIEFKDGATCAYNPDVVLDNLEPPPKIKGFILHDFKGTSIGRRWGSADHNWIFSFPCLVHIVIWKCGNLQQMPILSMLCFLKSLSLVSLDSLEYMEDAMSSSFSDEEVAQFFPSLETLKIMWMDRLKGWWKMDGKVDDRGLRLRFPSLLYLKIYKCPNLMSFASCEFQTNTTLHEFPSLRSLKIANCPNLDFNLICPTVETLELRDVGARLQITCGNSYYDSNLRHVEVDNVRHLRTLKTNVLVRLCIHGDLKVWSLSEVEDLFESCASSLRKLEVRYCANLRELWGLEHVTALEELKLLGNNELSISGDQEGPWKFFDQTLLRLKFDALPKMRSLPKGMLHFTSLQILELRWCENLEELPQWMSCLSSLKSLTIICCPRIRFLPEAMKDLTSLKSLSIQHGSADLNRRCKNPDGEDFHKIQHIPNISIASKMEQKTLRMNWKKEIRFLSCTYSAHNYFDLN